jgi:two-component system response regulator MprA
MASARIGICEDDSELRSVLTRTFDSEDFTVDATITGHQAMERFVANPPDVMVLDIGLPDADGRDVCQALRAQGVMAPVIFLTARDALTDRLSGFSAGGDDYLSKPFEIAELLARVNALLRRSDPRDAATPGDLRLDPSAHALRIGERLEQLTPTEFRIFAALAAKPGSVLRRAELVAAAWPDGAIVHDNTLDTYIARLRRKLVRLDADTVIATARGVGYTLQ